MAKVAKKFPNMKIIKVHGFRGTHATMVFNVGEQINDVQNRLGHYPVKTTIDS